MSENQFFCWLNSYHIRYQKQKCADSNLKELPNLWIVGAKSIIGRKILFLLQLCSQPQPFQIMSRALNRNSTSLPPNIKPNIAWFFQFSLSLFFHFIFQCPSLNMICVICILRVECSKTHTHDAWNLHSHSVYLYFEMRKRKKTATTTNKRITTTIKWEQGNVYNLYLTRYAAAN